MAEKKIGLVLSGGGARGAYQAGVLKALFEINGELKKPQQFKILTGVSAGAINSVHLASMAHDPQQCIKKNIELWSTVNSKKVFRTDFPSLGKIGLEMVRDLSFGSIFKKKFFHSFLDTKPLEEYLAKHISFESIQKNIDEGLIDAVAVTATSYTTSQCISFFQGKDSISTWKRSRRRGERVKLGVEHIMASSSIPIFFPPVALDERFFADGSLRNLAPLSAAIHLGAEKLFIVGVNYPKYLNWKNSRDVFSPSLARILSVLINAIFFDATEGDVERLTRINEILRVFPEERHHNVLLKPIDYFWIRPSEDLSQMAKDEAKNLPKLVRYLLGGLGSEEEGADLISFLLFEPGYCSRLVELGYKDCMDRKKELVEFLKK